MLPVDAHPQALKWPDGSLMANRVQTYDSPFSLSRANGITLHKDGFATRIACSTLSVQVGPAVK
ncbi:immune inhibitor A domain-containing protein [Streptomyces capitiformicae]|uniref:Immune inhibitor A-like metallopeptidase VEG domain-containing protein n=1 Tax=Streptomyces capitiformicae TaxID=2014920 RepID=A0A919L4K3_9ACTN|nr:immune inhibitor A domain-containing protein [Streptomyces capitiformicae]GHH83758.1 hypothetical protein GCM10017771_11170 [Streptomyces capitiformicae]